MSFLSESKWLNLRISAQMMILSTMSENAETFLVSARKLKTPMILNLSFTIYFRRSSSTSARTYREPVLTTTTRLHEAETARATCRWRRLRMARLKILILISLKSMRFEQAFDLPFTWQTHGHTRHLLKDAKLFPATRCCLPSLAWSAPDPPCSIAFS